jgi:glutathione synthase
VDEVLAQAKKHGRVVIKPWDGNGGRGVLVTGAGDRNLRSMAELLTDEGRTYCLVQPFIEAIKDGDKRIILIDGKPRGWFLRIPGPDDHRGNMHVGATVHACELDARDRAICAALEGRLVAEGLLFVGIDVIGGFLTEINVTSPTGFVEIQSLMGRDLACELQDAAQQKLAVR